MKQTFSKWTGTHQGMRFYVAALASLLIVMVLSLTGFLNIGSFQKSYIDSLVSSYGVTGSEARRTIEYSVKYHKPLNNFAGMGEILSDIKKQAPTVENVFVMLPNGDTLYDISGPTDVEALPENLLTKINFSDAKKKNNLSWLLSGDEYHALIPLRDANQDWIGTIDIVFNENAVSEKMTAYLSDTLKIMVSIALATILCIVLVVYRIHLFLKNGQLNKRGLLIAMTLILATAQASFGVLNVVTFRSAYLEVVNNNLNIAADMISKRINRVVGFGFTYEELDGVDDWLKNLAGPVKEINYVNLNNPNGDTLFSSSIDAKQSTSNQAQKPEAQQDSNDVPQVSRLLGKDSNGLDASLVIAASKSYIDQKVFSLALDAVTMFVTSIFFLVEMLVFIIIVLSNKVTLTNLHEAEKTDPSHTHGMTAKQETALVITQHENCVRVLAFLLLLCSYMSISFIPLLMKDIYRPLWGLSFNVIVGLPIASEMFGAFLSSLLAGYFIDRYGWRPVFVCGFILLSIATVISALSSDAVNFIAIRCFVGIGYGAAWMGLRGLVATGKSNHERTHGFSILNAGIFAGMNCGAVIGALLAQRIGFPAVMILASMMIAVALPFTFSLTVNSKPAITGNNKLTLAGLRTFFLHKDTFFFFLLITIPSAITSSFLTYFFPIFANSVDVSQGDIGRGFLLYGICMVFIGPLLVKFLAGRKVNTKHLMLGSCLIGVLSLSTFWSAPTFIGALIAIVILGISDSVGLVSQNSYFMSIPAAEKIGHGKALSFYSAMKKVGQFSGPAVFGVAVSLGTLLGVGLIASAYLITTISFGLASRESHSDINLPHSVD
ncbi:hypothetical protein B6A14_00675 [Polynucleobacter hirudinilacicola]|uniref:Major facilitator superfamily (MFS) profile domain-containing protein n=1 Tax=Polynucleobacter hirudinilacicola TaxID=1743166 RepID=A0A210RZV5_9BURK|nr:MFS transporter [Polynucleobacter hirudinilacicola]OWF66531.1 hypothetical protein B6A14_00675 [Polynucleobacter hirudinilacicola]